MNMEEVNYMNEINRLDEKIEKLSEKLNLTELKLERNNVLTENNTEVMKKTAETLDSVRLTMCQLSGQIEIGNKISSDLAKSVESISDKQQSLEEKVDTQLEDVRGKIKDVDDKGKIDIVEVGKAPIMDNMKNYLAFGGVSAAIITIVEFIKAFLEK